VNIEREAGTLPIIAATLLSIAALNYWFYDRFLMSYVLATQCLGCDAPAAATTPLELALSVALLGAYLLVLTRVRSPSLLRVWVAGTAILGLLVWGAMANAHKTAISGHAQRWTALHQSARLALGFGTSLAFSSLIVLVRKRQRAAALGVPAVVALTGVLLSAHGARSLNSGNLPSPISKSALLLAGTQDIAIWWQKSVTVVLVAGSALALLAARSRQPRDICAWLALTTGAAAVFFTVPHVRDALQPLSLREPMPPGLSQVSACSGQQIPESLSLEHLANANVDPARAPVGYLAQPLTRSARELRPLLEAARDQGIVLVVVPVRHTLQTRSQTLGLLSFDEVCWGGQFRLAKTGDARPLSELSTLGDLIRSPSAIDPTAGR
jgi:hypothetical protein